MTPLSPTSKPTTSLTDECTEDRHLRRLPNTASVNASVSLDIGALNLTAASRPPARSPRPPPARRSRLAAFRAVIEALRRLDDNEGG